jgi:DNA-binding LacI/PurR family transcriptional regulator
MAPEEEAAFPHRVSLRDIARLTGYSHATVSMALRMMPAIRPATRRKILKAAAQLGYRPDPMLSSLAAYRQGKRAPAFHGTLAYINNHPDPASLHNVPIFADYLRGAAHRAERLGYKVEEFWLRQPGMTQRRFEKILTAHGIHGLLLAPQPADVSHLETEFADFSCVALGYSLEFPRFHIVATAQFLGAVKLTHILLERGYRRILFISSKAFEQRTACHYLGGFHTTVMQSAGATLIPPLLHDESTATADQGAFGRLVLAELRKHRADAVISTAPWTFDQLRDCGIRIPGDVALATLAWHATHPHVSGLHQRGVATGRAAVDLLSGMLMRGERGVPSAPCHLLIEPGWQEGETCPPRGVSSRKGKKPRPRARASV